MGGKPKGKRRPRSMTAAVSIARPLAVSMLRTGAEKTVVNLAAAAVPPYAPFIYGGHFALRTGWSAVQAYREYKELRQRMSQARALRVQSERTGFRAGAELSPRQADPELRMHVQTHIGILLARPEVNAMIEKALGDKATEEMKQRFKMIFLETSSQFLLGSVEGGRGKIVDDAAKLFFR